MNNFHVVDVRQVWKKDDSQAIAPVFGIMLPIGTVNDPVFSSKLMGESSGIIPSTGEVVCPGGVFWWEIRNQ